jgi:hypothetical protein
MTREEEIAALRLKLKQREGRQGYKANCEAIRAKIAELEAEGEE